MYIYIYILYEKTFFTFVSTKMTDIRLFYAYH